MIPIGKVLRALRNKHGLSLRRLGSEIGISFNTLNAYERNVIHPTLESSYKMARFFEVPIEYFIYGEKTTQEFHDAELRALFQEADTLNKENRSVIKSYLRKYLSTRKQLDELIEEAHERPSAGVERNPIKKQKKNLKNT
jgi:transcriptional regulator with XRE-family HTH domain